MSFISSIKVEIAVAFSFNGEPQAWAKSGNDACGLPLNE
jgi:hypothetical protein